MGFDGCFYLDNFINFAPLGPVLTVMVGIGVAERTGFISMGLRVLVPGPDSLLTATVVFAGVMSSMAADAGYVVLTPLEALLLPALSATVGWTRRCIRRRFGWVQYLLITKTRPNAVCTHTASPPEV